MKNRFLKIAKEHGYLISDYKFERSDMGMMCFQFECNNGAFKFTHYCSYPFGAGTAAVKQVLFDMLENRFKSPNPIMF